MRRVRTSLYVCVLLTGLSCGPGFRTWVPRASEVACNGDTGYGGVRAGLDRKGCYGSCPVYRVNVCGDGTVVYDGQVFVKTQGRKTRSLSDDALALLLDELGRIPRSRGPVDDPIRNDGPSVHVWMTTDGAKRWLVDRTPDGRETADILERHTGVLEWVGTEAERDALRRASQ